MIGTHVFPLLLIFGLAQTYPSVRENVPAYIQDLQLSNGGRITGGWEAGEGQMPYQISLRMVSAAAAVSSCGGSLIHEEWVITAAHCLANRITYIVRIGAQNLTRPALIIEETIENRIMHPRYVEDMVWVQGDDIALLKLSTKIQWGPTIQPIRLQNSRQKDVDYSGRFLTVSGYGLTNDTRHGGTTSEVLMFVHLRGISNVECQRWFAPFIHPQTVCAQYYNRTVQSACSGDSGGPLTVVDEDGELTMVGIVSFGAADGCTLGIPSAYVRPGYYQDWIRENTGIDFDWGKPQEILEPEPVF